MSQKISEITHTKLSYPSSSPHHCITYFSLLEWSSLWLKSVPLRRVNFTLNFSSFSLHILLVTVSVDSVFWIVFDLNNPLHSRSAGYWHFSLEPVQSPHGPLLCLCSCTSNPISASQFLSKWKLEDVMCFLKMLKLIWWNLSFLTWFRSL